MGLDGVYLHLLAGELRASLVGARVEKIYQPTKTELLFAMRTREDRYRLLLSANGNAPGIRLTQQSIDNPEKPPMLCMLLRKHLVGGTLTAVAQVGMDRILRLSFSVINELGDRVERHLIIEIMARHSNIILLDADDVVIDSVKRVDLATSSVRQILPGMRYVLPPRPDKLDPAAADAQTLLDRVASSDKPLGKALLNAVEGLSPLTANELAFRAGGDDLPANQLSDRQQNALRFELETLHSRVTGGSYTPCLIRENGRMKEFSYMQITCFGAAVTPESREDLSRLMDDFYAERDRYTRTHAKAEDLFRTVTSLRERTSRRLDNRRLELEACADREEKRRFAELINANLYQLRKGQDAYAVCDWYDEGKSVTIPVKPELTPAENAARYFREYKKRKTAEERLTDLIAQDERDIEYLGTVLDELSRAENDREIAAIRRELAQEGYLKRQTGRDKKQAAEAGPREYRAPSGLRVLVGRNNAGNDKLSFRIAGKDDLWFHAQKMPGSHVVLCGAGLDAPDADIEFAAGLAAWFSAGRDATTVEIDYTPVRELRKPAGARPGFVIYHTYYSMSARPLQPQEETV